MEKEVAKRRGFLKGFGLVGAVVGGVVAGREILSNNAPAPVALSAPTAEPDIAHLAPKEGATSLMITGDNRPPPPPAPVQSWSAYNVPNNGYTIACATMQQSTLSIGTNMCPSDELNKVSMAVGKDDRLWIKVGDAWKRVVVEG